MNPSVLLESLSSAERAKTHYVPGRTAQESRILWLQDQNFAREGERTVLFFFKCSKCTDEDPDFHHFPPKAISVMANKSLIYGF